MTKPDLLAMMRLLSALESWSFSPDKLLPDYLSEELLRLTRLLETEILKDTK